MLAKHLYAFSILAASLLALAVVLLSSCTSGAQDADGSRARNLTQNRPVVNRWPAWSPDDGQIAFLSTRDGNQDIYVMAADGSNVRCLTNRNAANLSPAWSPDGSQIAFASGRDSKYDMYE